MSVGQLVLEDADLHQMKEMSAEIFRTLDFHIFRNLPLQATDHILFHCAGPLGRSSRYHPAHFEHQIISKRVMMIQFLRKDRQTCDLLILIILILKEWQSSWNSKLSLSFSDNTAFELIHSISCCCNLETLNYFEVVSCS